MKTADNIIDTEKAMKFYVKILSVRPVTHDVIQIVVEKPDGYNFTPGQATDVSINKNGWRTKKRSFTFTNLSADSTLAFVIKTYPYHHGVTHQLRELNPGDELILHDVYGEIKYKGPGVFIAGGAGITPFLSIFRDLKWRNKPDDNTLLFANKTKNDIILESELKDLLGAGFINILSEENVPGYLHGYITREIIESYSRPSETNYYLCGPPPMMKAIDKILQELGTRADQIIKESF